MDDNLTHKTGKAADLEPRFEEILQEFAEQVVELTIGEGVRLGDPSILNPEIEKAKRRLMDAVADTVILDAH